MIGALGGRAWDGSPPVVVLTDRTACAAAGRDLADVCAAAVEAGAAHVLVREKDLAPGARAALVHRVVDAVGGHRVIVAVGAAPGGEELRRWAELNVAGVHLASPRVAMGMASGAGAPADGPTVSTPPWGRSCHGAEDVAVAALAGASWVTVSPVAASTSKPGYGQSGCGRSGCGQSGHGRPGAEPGAVPGLGESGLARLVAVAASLPRLGSAGSAGPHNLPGAYLPGAYLPGAYLTGAYRPGARRTGAGREPQRPAVLALGGVTPSNASRWLAAGADGIAVLGSVMAAVDPGAAVRALLRAAQG